MSSFPIRSQSVLARSNWLQVPRVDAGSVAAQMVKMEAAGYSTDAVDVHLLVRCSIPCAPVFVNPAPILIDVYVVQYTADDLIFCPLSTHI